MKLTYTPKALLELNNVLDYLGQHSPSGKRNVAKRLRALIELLPNFPQMGRETEIYPIRVVVANPYPYLIFYVVEKDELVIVGVRHAKQDPDTRP